MCTQRDRIAVLAVAGFLAAVGAPLAAADEATPALPLATLPDAAGIVAAVEVAIPLVELPLPSAEQEPSHAEPMPAPEPPISVSEPVPDAPAGDALSPTPPLEAVAAAVQQRPVNVNVSVRVESPGDDGAVTQTNAVAGTSAAVAVPLPVSNSRYQDVPAQYQSAAAPGSSSDPPPAPEPQQPATAPAAWIWNWDCADGMPASFNPPPGTLPDSWIWNWSGNCASLNATAENTNAQSTAQYQRGIAQYQPVNMNVSIRIASAGANGPVVQANVAVSVAVVSSPIVVEPDPRPPVEPVAQNAPPTSADVAPVSPAVAGSGPVEEPQRSPVRFTLSAPIAPSGREYSVSPSPDTQLAAASTSRARIEATARLVATLAPPRPALEAAARSRVPEQRRHRPPALRDLTRAPVGSLGLTAAPQRAGFDLTSFLIFVFLAAFVFAFADAAWRVRDGWQPAAAEPGRRRERPG